MQTPNDINGTRTEMIMQNLTKEVFGGEMETARYNKMYSVIYDTLSKISNRNLLRGMQELGIKLVDTSPAEKAIDELRKARQLDPEDLHKPMTI